MHVNEIAAALARKGFYVFPITAGQKSPPAITGWQKAATRNQEGIKSTFIGTDYNIGISTSQFNGAWQLLVIDVDTKKGNGNETLAAIEAEHGALPPTYTQRTPTGGRHLVYKTMAKIGNSVNRLGDSVDVRGAGGYIVAAGSKVKAGTYKANKQEVAEAPAWLCELCKKGVELDTAQRTGVEVEEDRARERVKLYLADAPVAIEGEGGDATTFKVAARVKDFGVSPAVALECMLDYWNDRCEPPWDPEDLKVKIHNAYKHAQNEGAVWSAENVFTKVPRSENANKKEKRTEQKTATTKPIPAFMEEMNKEFALVLAGGNHFVLREDHSGDSVRTMQLSENTFNTYMANKEVAVLAHDKKGQPYETSMPIAKAWIQHPARRTYEDIVFDPSGKAPSKYYNLWTGLAYEPKADENNPGLKAWKEHVFKNICNGDAALAKWLVGYFAHLVQRPAEKPLVALAFQGAKGVGKNAAVERVGALLGQHALVTHDRRYLTGNFNVHLQNLLMLVLDEAYWSGDKKAEGVLKGIITSPTQNIEPKGKEAYSVANYMRVILIGNEDWIVPASHDERRFAVFTVGEGRKQDTEFFAKMRTDLERGGYPALLAFLLNFDISSIDVNVAPVTAGLTHQKISSMPMEHAWWFDVLDRAVVPGTNDEWDEPTRMLSSLAHEDFLTYAKKHGQRFHPSAQVFYRKLADLRGNDGYHATVNGKRGKGYVLRSLEEERNQFSKMYGGSLVWS